MWSKDTDQGQYNVFKAVGLTNLQEIIVTWIEERGEYEITQFYYIRWLKWLKAFILKGLRGFKNNTILLYRLYKDNTFGVKI